MDYAIDGEGDVTDGVGWVGACLADLWLVWLEASLLWSASGASLR